MKIRIHDDKIKQKLGEDADTVDKMTNEALEWMKDEDSKTTEDYENKLKELETQLSPLVQKLIKLLIKQRIKLLM